jgi:hypothetical protein
VAQPTFFKPMAFKTMAFKPMAPSGGAFLVFIGAGLIGFALGPLELRVKLFFGASVIGVVALIVVSALGRILRRTRPPTRAEMLLVWPPVAAEFALMLWLTIYSQLHLEERPAWLLSLAIVGVHFLPMIWSFGPAIALLGLSCLATAGAGWAFPEAPLAWIIGLDGTLKLGFGAWMFSSLLQPARPIPA